MVLDWGLAKSLRDGAAPAAADASPVVSGSDEHLTQAGLVLGTPAYMAPEQAAGTADPAGPAADIYALGAILYELLAGQPPYSRTSAQDVLAQVRHGPPPSPRQVRTDVPASLDALCRKAMSRAPDER